jgi:hypothetical protein
LQGVGDLLLVKASRSTIGFSRVIVQIAVMQEISISAIGREAVNTIG